MADREFDIPSPDVFAELADAADFLLPVAQAHVDSGAWPIQVAAWLLMMRDESAAKACPVH